MAGDWIPMEHALIDKPEVLGIVERTGLPIDTVIGRLFMLWRLMDRETLDGSLQKVGPKGLAARCGGKPSFWQAVADVGWLDFTPEGVNQIGFTKKNGKSTKRRILESVRKLSARHADKMQTSCAPACGHVAPPPPPPPPESESESDFGGGDHVCAREDAGSLPARITVQALGPLAKSAFAKSVGKLVERGKIPEFWVLDAIEAVKQAKPERPVGYFRQVLSNMAREHGCNLGTLIEADEADA